jgi:mxaJ protein
MKSEAAWGAAIAAVVYAGLFALMTASPQPVVAPLRVCADPNNMPFSNDRGEGFENRLAELLAADMGRRVEYTWWAQRRGFVRNTLGAARCDVVMGVPTRFALVEATRPYYRSTYVFLSRRDRYRDLGSFDDQRLRHLRIGVQIVGDDYANTPPAHALSARGLVQNVVGYSVLGNYAEPNPPARVVDAVVRGDVDVAVVWGPLAGYFARRSPVLLEITAVRAQSADERRSLVFDMSLGVRRGDTANRARLDEVLARRRPEIDRLLAQFGVPRTDVIHARAGL